MLNSRLFLEGLICDDSISKKPFVASAKAGDTHLSKYDALLAEVFMFRERRFKGDVIGSVF